MAFRKQKTTRFLTLIAALEAASGVHAQTQLTPGVPAQFLETTIFNVLLNGRNGFVIPVTADPLEVAINVVVAPSTVTFAVYARCGSDVGGTVGAVVFDAAAYTVEGVANLFIERPAGGTAGNCYVALNPQSQPPSSLGTGGKVTVNLNPLSPGTQVAVSSLGNIYLAGQPGGTKFGTLAAPSNSPVQAPITLTAGQALGIRASGLVSGAPPEGTVLQLNPSATAGGLGLSDITVPGGALVGVFVGDTIDSTKTPVGIDFSAAMAGVQALYPVLQQVFYIGNGVTPTGQQRVFVVPSGATRLFLASNVGGFNATGSFNASITPATVPTAPAATNPITISPLSDLFMVDQPNGTVSGAKVAYAAAPYCAPTQVPVTLTPGQNLHIRALDTISSAISLDTIAGQGLSASPPAKGLIGVFLGPTIDRTHAPANLDPSEPTQTFQPLLQQVFFIGNGLTSGSPSPSVLKSFTIPAGATRLFLSDSGGGLPASGYATATVTVDNSNAPQISTGGIVTNAGFGTGPVSPGSMVAIFGSNFGPLTFPSALPLPTMLGGTQVFFNSVPAPLFYVSPTQIVVQVPFEMYGLTQAMVTVVSQGIAGVPQPVSLTTFAANIFTTSTGAPVITDANTGAVVSTQAPASRGDTLVLWGTGLGPTVLDPATGSVAPNTISPALIPINVILKSPATGASVTVTPVYAGLAPGFIALDQINVPIPANAPTGTVILQLQSPGLQTPTAVTIGIQ